MPGVDVSTQGTAVRVGTAPSPVACMAPRRPFALPASTMPLGPSRILAWSLLLAVAVSIPQVEEFIGDLDEPLEPRLVQKTNIAPVVLSDPGAERDIEVPPFVDFDKNAPCASKILDLMPEHVLCLQDIGTELPLTDSDPGIILDLHNEDRAKVNPSASNMLSLVWDGKLAELAGKAARQCNVTLNLKDPPALHSLPEFPGVYLAMNLAAGAENWTQAIDMWFAQGEIFEYGAGSLSNSTTFEYTNMVAATSSRVGCGAANCPKLKSQKNFVCYYASEYEDGKEAYPYEQGDWCSACMTCTASGKLCTCNGRVCLNGGRLNSKTCTCNCFDSFRGSSCEIRRSED